MPVASTSCTYWTLRSKLLREEPFVLSRFGDGEFEIMLGRRAMQQEHDERLAQELVALYDHPSPLNMIATAMHRAEPGMRAGLFLPWQVPEYAQFDRARLHHNAIALHYMAVFQPMRLRSLFDVIRRREKIFLGPEIDDTRVPLSLFGEHEHVAIPGNDAYATIDDWYPALEAKCGPNQLIVLAAGPAGRAVNLRLLDRRQPVQLLDIGSVLSFAMGWKTHTWHRLASDDAREVLLGHD